MKKFILKSLSFILLIYISFFTFYKYYNINNKLEKEILGKVNALKPHIKNKKCIVIAGDSRGERHLIPKEIERITGIKTINIAIPGGGLISYLPYLDEFNKDSTFFIFSASSWQINDDIIGPENMTLEPYLQLSLYQKIYLYKYNIKNLIYMEDQLIRSTCKDFYRNITNNTKEYKTSDKLIKSLGFYGVNKKMNFTKMSTLLNSKKNLVWYKNFKGDGFRFNLFKESIEKLKKSNFKMLIYQPDSSPLFKIKGKSNGMDFTEKQFSKKLKKLTENSENIKYIDFYNNPILSINDEYYYDPQHLNYNGAKMFTVFLTNEYLLKKINKTFFKKAQK